ncbi:MAG TPA: DUF4129 domain-containing protein, partial [Polyangia bacterium]|nr:DUF4129 domain-containing protein [Polyangia bacterium]
MNGPRLSALAALLALALLAGAGRAAPEPTETPRVLPAGEAVQRTLASPRYRYCHDPKYPLTDDEVRWCQLLPKPSDPLAARCPEFAAACRAGATARTVPPVKPWHLDLPDFGGVGRLFFWAMVLAVVAGLLFLLVRAGMHLAGRRRPDRAEAPPVAVSAAGPAVIDVVERDVERLLARARAAAARGDFTQAIADLHAALLRRLDGDGHVRIHPSATNGDYVRELRGRAPALAGPVREITRDIEAVQFGTVQAGEGLFQTLLGRVIQVVTPRRAGLPAGLSVLMFALLLSSGMLSCTPNVRPDWRDSPSGSAAVAAVLDAAGLKAEERLRPLSDLSDHRAPGSDVSQDAPAQLVLLPDAEVGDAEWAKLRQVLEGFGPTLVILGPRRLPDWVQAEVVASGASGELRATSALPHAGRHDDDDDDDGDEEATRAALEDEKALLAHKGNTPGHAWVRVDNAVPHDVLLKRGGQPYAIELYLSVGRLIVVADGTLFTNAALSVGGNAELLLAVMRSGGAGIHLVGADTGLVASTPLDSVARGRLAPFLAQLGAALILFFLMQGAAFGRLQDPQREERRQFSEHVRALGLQYARGRAARHVLGAYAAWTVERLRERIRLPRERGLGDLAAAVAVRTDRSLGEVARALFAARQDAGDGGGKDQRGAEAEQLATLRTLRQLLSEISGKRATTSPRPQSIRV